MQEIAPQSLKLPNHIVPQLQKPLGIFFKVEVNEPSPEQRVIEFLKDEKGYVFVVGDFVSNSLLNNDFVPDLIIIDNKTQRNTPFKVNLPAKFERIEVSNNQGEINKATWELLRILCASIFDDSEEDNSIELEKILKVITIIDDGEEDLLVLPLIIEAPIGSYILYGFPPMINGDKGIILIQVNQESKQNAKNLLSQFEIL